MLAYIYKKVTFAPHRGGVNYKCLCHVGMNYDYIPYFSYVLSLVEMKSLTRLVIIWAFLSTFAHAILIVPYVEKPNGFDGPEELKELEGPKITPSPFPRMAMVVFEVIQSPNWNSLSDDEKLVVARFLYEMVANPPRLSPFGGLGG